MDGRLGDGSTTNRNTPTAVQHPTGVTFTQLSVGDGHTCALASGGQAWCWGKNADGQVGDSTTATRAAPVAVPQPTGVAFATIRAGGDHTCAATSGGQAYCWGANGQGQLGDSTTMQRTNEKRPFREMPEEAPVVPSNEVRFSPRFAAGIRRSPGAGGARRDPSCAGRKRRR
ncbi:MAG TPA: hypothetical protein VEX86_08895 [Longimicrobium sp.]|nr:hypothetical protein [Longimicrobium sp.]